MTGSWTRWKEKDILGVLSDVEWRTFRELQKLITHGHIPWAGDAFFKAMLRRLVQERKVELRVRNMVGVRRGRGPDEFRRRT